MNKDTKDVQHSTLSIDHKQFPELMPLTHYRPKDSGSKDVRLKKSYLSITL